MMLRAAGLAVFSALLGGGLALAARRHPALLERTRTFAFAAAAGVVAFHLLPELLPDQGVVALLWMAAGFALPWVLEVAARMVGPGLLEKSGLSGLRVAAEVGFAALIFHSVVEGLALVAALARPRGQADLEIALVAHHAPLTAAVVLPFLDLKGPRSAAVRSAMVAAAGLLGVALSGVVPGLGAGALLQKATAVTAGALLHVVADEIRAQRFGSRWERAADLGACAVGLLVAGVGAVLHLRDGREAAPLLEFIRVLAGIALSSAPALLFGALGAALLAARGVTSPLQRVDAFLLALVLLGPAATLALLLFGMALRGRSSAGTRPSAPAALIGGIRDRAPALLALLVVAAGLEVSASPPDLHSATGWLLLAALALCSRLDEAGAVAVAGVLVHKGLDPAFAVALLALGPATRAAPLRALLSAAVALAAGWLLSFSRLLAGAGRAAFQDVHEPIAAQLAGSPLAAVAAAVLVALALGTLWTAGVRGWFAPLRHGPRAA
jgi:hypothetical protein